jgi:5'(3')-deoxyribonucleotidase
MYFKNIKNIDELLKYAKTPSLWVDLDGVLVNFDKGFEDLEGCSPQEYIDEHGKEKFWKAFPKHPRFFRDLEWMPDGKELWNYIKQYNPTVLTAPPRESTMPHAKKDKETWVKKHLGEDVKVIVEANKDKYAKKDYILIDDREKNTVPWESAEGTAILHTSAKDTIEKLQKLL